MSLIELIPLNKGNHIILDDTTTITIGRTPHTGCLDNKISRNHAQLFLKSDGTLWIKPIHHNPTFYKTKKNQIVTLTKDKPYQLYDSDQFGLLPDEYFYRVIIKPKNNPLEEPSSSNQTTDSSTTSKSSNKINNILTIENNDDEEKNIMESKSSSSSNTTRAVPNGISNSSTATSIRDREQNNDNTNTSTPIKEQTHSEEKEIKDDHHDSSSGIAKTVHATTTDNIDFNTNSPTSSSVAIATSSTKRERCAYGESCYRTNFTHRQQVTHPGDQDWDDTAETDKNKTKPECPYGDECYRKNPEHFIEYHHPKKTCIDIKNKRKTRKRKSSEVDDDDDGLPNDYDYNDSFIDDEDFDDSNLSSNGEESRESDSDSEWEPTKHSTMVNTIEDDSSNESDFDLTKKEADEFTKTSNSTKQEPSIKKRRLDDDDHDHDHGHDE